ncbi:Vga family ABC-F type ribosomal protection protein [Lederbergia wuyishanensis]|uniref:Pleuromutilin/lincosamide/streptogramin A transport system ATP-binding/permease protein n=1 Tax=Lederbergia wuyishanensis TaxID=1347903 RepID=A0ABU0D063_9BACI|nr:Vga family ABC-F type ribosomal protection protein [Lederbergia wuyishanensis]MCJ8006409.1 Vga family ABC-F type ribosomal protection protein [Lederbergia wuyishanensis]MDQ0341781.1 pleuromutilin/lincosamide/streptogramin A transport system ATP-binding/permease protein [Lederbergia wuyishanensis]
MMLLEANELKLYIKDRLLIDIEHLMIQSRDCIGLVGRNGSGKTTLLELLSKKLIPDEGNITSNVESVLLPQLKHTHTTKSGGEITQEYINRALANKPELLLADEPTTNLDTFHIEKLEKQLKKWQGAIVIVSHDRAFLDSLCTKIWDIEDGKVREYKGNYTDYLSYKELERKQQENSYEQYERKKKQLEEALILKEQKAARATKTPKKVSPSESRITGAKPYFANKQKKLRKAAKAIETRLDKLEKVEKLKDIPAVKMKLPNEESFKGRTVLRLKDVTGSIPNRILWKKTSFEVKGGDKLAIIGKNGSGKTTLLKKIMNKDYGISISPSVQIGYFSQNLDILNVNESILTNVQSTSTQDESFIRTVLARLRFFRDDVYKKVNVLSGGERVKVAFAKIFVSDINTLILDEPTNFLDIESVEALESLLQEYEGTVILVSHDRRFIQSIANIILSIENEEIQIFDGTYEEYLQYSPAKDRNTKEDELLLLETKISDVLSRLSIDPSDELEMEFQILIAEKNKLKKG